MFARLATLPVPSKTERRIALSEPSPLTAKLNCVPAFFQLVP
uniref:Uncharacterized protein n=1 Tax=Myoviridae sp. ct1PY2 TaxID=2826602 RepID=A0A8S5MLS5_9CAUD|nr:MAG TPA: hypothetical protein [Myoviridae sp. ct1PY2]